MIPVLFSIISPTPIESPRGRVSSWRRRGSLRKLRTAPRTMMRPRPTRRRKNFPPCSRPWNKFQQHPIHRTAICPIKASSSTATTLTRLASRSTKGYHHFSRNAPNRHVRISCGASRGNYATEEASQAEGREVGWFTFGV